MEERNDEGAVSAEELGGCIGCLWVSPLIVLLLIVLYSCAATVAGGGR